MTGNAEPPLLRSTLNRLPKQANEREPGWLLQRRDEAAELLRAQGFPGPKDEAWRFTPIRPITRIPFGSAPDHATVGGAAAACHVSLVNGRVRTFEAPPGVWTGSLSEALAEHPAIVEESLGRIAANEDGFAAANAALFSDACVVVVPPNVAVESPIRVLRQNRAGKDPIVACNRILVVLGSGAEACLVETVEPTPGGQHLDNSVTEIAVGPGAELRHVRFRTGQPDAFVVETVAVRLERDSRYRSSAVTLGGPLARFGTDVRLQGPGAECALDGLFMAGSAELVDHHTRVVHAVAQGHSRQLYKGIVDGSGTGVFDGIVVVASGAQATEAHQQSQNLVLSPDAELHTKPHLEIDADDVRCSHGATVGRLDDNQLFYLRSRGLDERTARAALTYGFAQEVIDRIEIPAVRDAVRESVLARLPHGDLAKEISS